MKAKTLTYRQWQALQAVIDEPNLSHADRVGRAYEHGTCAAEWRRENWVEGGSIGI